MGARPWRLVSPPIGDYESSEILFVGLAHDRDLSQLAGVGFNADGTIAGYSGLYGGPSLDTDFASLTGKVVGEICSLQRGSGVSRDPRRVIVHVPATIDQYGKQLASVIAKCGIACDAIAISPGSGPHLLQKGNQGGTPSFGIAAGDEHIAYLINTYAIDEKSNTGERIFPAPNTIVVRRIAGEMPMRLLAAQVFWLSAVHINAIHRTVDTPVTLDFADRLRQHIGKTRRSMPPTLGTDRVLFWL